VSDVHKTRNTRGRPPPTSGDARARTFQHSSTRSASRRHSAAGGTLPACVSMVFDADDRQARMPMADRAGRGSPGRSAGTKTGEKRHASCAGRPLARQAGLPAARRITQKVERDDGPAHVRFGSWLCENAPAAGLARSDFSREAAVGLRSQFNEFWTGPRGAAQGRFAQPVTGGFNWSLQHCS
jgi:hypothetical protein